MARTKKCARRGRGGPRKHVKVAGRDNADVHQGKPVSPPPTVEEEASSPADGDVTTPVLSKRKTETRPLQDEPAQEKAEENPTESNTTPADDAKEEKISEENVEAKDDVPSASTDTASE